MQSTKMSSNTAQTASKELQMMMTTMSEMMIAQMVTLMTLTTVFVSRQLQIVLHQLVRKEKRLIQSKVVHVFLQKSTKTSLNMASEKIALVALMMTLSTLSHAKTHRGAMFTTQTCSSVLLRMSVKNS